MNDSLNAMSWKYKLLTSLFSVLSLTIGIDIASAQEVTSDQKLEVISDQMLASENTQVSFTSGDEIYKITGGATRGNNLLFHSFNRFSVGEGETAFFDHGNNIETILSRVTGGDRSQINGIISTAGNADIFIINPQGITFGPNATLEIGGSFIASTAERIVFTEGSEFSAVDPQPILSVSQPIGLSLEGFYGDIVNKSTAFNSDLGYSVGLEVLPRESIMLVGNGIDLSGGGITSPSGQVELASLGPGSSVSLISPDSNDRLVWALDYGNDSHSLGDIKLSSGAFIYGTDFGISGSDRPNSHIQLRGSRIFLDGGNVNGGIYADNFGTDQGGNLILSASMELTLTNRAMVSVSTFGSGRGGDLTINAASLSVLRGTDVSTSTFGDGQGGNLVINTFGGSVEVAGISLADENGDVRESALSANTEGSQDAGEIQINTRTLSVRDSGQIESRTFANGNGGRVWINATESVVVTGQSSDIPSYIFSTTAAPRRGDPLLTTGDAGSVEIFTGRLEVSEGATIFTTSSSSGQGGDLTVEADEVVLSGQESGLYARARSRGDSGTVNLRANNTLRIENGAYLTVSNSNELLTDDFTAQDLGTVRDANIEAQSIILNNGQITAESLSGNGGNLNFNVQDFILLRNNSLISSTAGTAQAGGDGGNVTIEIPNGFIIAVPDENSDIIANAFSGTGGNIDITAQNIIGLDTRADTRTNARDNTTNDIEASSQFGLSGTITLNNLGLDPAEGLVELPTNTAEPNPVAQRCLADREGRSTFVVTGQGGNAPNPGDVVRNEAAGWVDLGPTAPLDSRSARQPNPIVSNAPAADPILVEAQGWQRDRNGQVTLIAQLPSAQATTGSQYSSCAHQSRR